MDYVNTRKTGLWRRDIQWLLGLCCGLCNHVKPAELSENHDIFLFYSFCAYTVLLVWSKLSWDPAMQDQATWYF